MKITLSALCLFAFVLQTAHAQEVPLTYSVVGVRQGDTLNVRQGPGASYPVVARLANGLAGIEVQGRPVMNGSDDWVHVTFVDGEGWTRPKFLTVARLARNSVTPATWVATADESPTPTPSVDDGNNTVVKAAIAIGTAYLLYKFFTSDSSSSSSSNEDEYAARQQQQRDYVIQAQYDREEKARQAARDADAEARRQEARANAPITHVYGQ